MLNVRMWQQSSFLSFCGHIIYATDELTRFDAITGNKDMLNLPHGKPTYQ